jgi:cysteine desulfurase
MGISDEDAHSSVRISLGRFTTDSEIQQAIHHIRQVVAQLRVA